MTQRIQSINIRGMHCTGCEAVIENAVKQLSGITEVSANFASDSVKILYDNELISVDTVIACIEKLGYQFAPETISSTHKSVLNATNESHADLRKALKKSATVIFALIGIGFILWLDSWFMDHTDIPKLDRDITYGLLTLIGFLTSFHCVGMCGSLILGYTAKLATNGRKSYNSHFLYGFGKTLSYTLIGALFGALGSVISFTPFTQGAVGVAAGVFLILFGLHMLQVIPALSHFQIKVPAIVTRFIGKEYRKHSNPFFIGLLNGLMIICGPLQAMYIMAAGTGSWLTLIMKQATLIFQIILLRVSTKKQAALLHLRLIRKPVKTKTLDCSLLL